MPIESTPPRRILEALKRLRDRNRARDTGRDTMQDGIVHMPVEAVADDGSFRVAGRQLSTTGVAEAITAGQVVPVAYRQGEPAVIVSHSARRAQFGPPPPGGGPIVEELFIATNPDTGLVQVWFRNATVLADLELRATLPGDPEQVKWGARGDSFFVRVASEYFTYKFARAGGIDVAMTGAPKPKLLKREFPWTNTVLVARVTYNGTITVDTPSIWSEAITVQDSTFPFNATTDVDGNLATVLSRSGSKTRVTELRLTDGLPGFGLFDAELDWKYNLVVTVQFNPFLSVIPPSDSVSKIQDKSYQRIEQPIGNIIAESGDPTAYAQACALDGPGVAWSAPNPDGDFHVAVVNVTEARVLWRSTPALPTLNWTGRSDANIGYAVLTQTTFFIGPPDNFRYTKSASQSTSLLYFPTQASPPTDPNADFVDVSLPTQSLGSRSLIDAVALAFLNLPFPISGGDVSSSATRYGADGIVFASRGQLINDVPQAGFKNLYLRGAISNVVTTRANRLLLYPVRYLPHRTKDLGDLYLFAICLALDPSTGNATGQKYSLWKYSLDTGAAQALVDWTDEPVANDIGTPSVVGASLRHMLWTLSTFFGAGPFFKRFRIMLSGQGAATKVLIDKTAPDPGPDPAEVVAFLARNWELPRPDLFYLLDDATDPRASNQFLQAWNTTTITLDPADLKVDGVLRGLGALKKMRAGVSPLTGDAAPSVRALESAAALRGRFLKDP